LAETVPGKGFFVILRLCNPPPGAVLIILFPHGANPCPVCPVTTGQAATIDPA